MRNLTLVVGGGPAGSSCAWKLASAHIPCRVVEKQDFPRDKVCGGILSRRACSVLTGSGMVSAEELEDLTLRKHSKISFFHRGEFLRTYTSATHPVRVVSRKRFDSFLLDRARSAGAEVITGVKVESVDSRSAVTSTGEKMLFSHLVGADGCTSVVRKLVSDRRSRKTGMGLEYLVPLSEMDRQPDGIEIHFGHLPYGYLWVIPGKDRASVGAGAAGSPASPEDIVEALGKFMDSLSISRENHQLRGASMPSLVLHGNLGRDNLYLVGDAAGLVDHISGEGIGYAAESGFMAADCILAGDDRKSILRRDGNCIRMVRQSILYRHLLFSRLTRGTAMIGLRDSVEFARGYWNIISGVETYNTMFSRILDLQGGTRA